MTEMVTSPAMKEYFERFKKDCYHAYGLANKARSLGYDPEEEVSVTLAETLAERVIGLIAVVAPQIKNAGVEKRIEDLEAKYGILDWRVAFQIALEVAQERFCKFNDEVEAMTIGVKVGFAYNTLGVVSSPLEGLTTIELKKRNDYGTAGKEGKNGTYFCLNFAGPIRNAGGTAAAVSVLIADYVRVNMGYAEYDPTEKEIKRCPAELEDYHEWVTNLQYFPSKEESLFLLEHLPVEISGEGSEKYEISNVVLKDLPRVQSNIIRSGYCLIHSSCIPLKAAKLWKNLDKWGKDFGMAHWNFLKEFLDIQKKMKAAGKKSEGSTKITPDYTYIKDLVAGRPVLGYPLRSGGFRLRYGRSRASGYSGQAIHPCTMHVLNNYIASATQLKVERPGKAAAFMPCDTLDGPIVRLTDGTVMQLSDEDIAKSVAPRIDEIIYIGDVLINYGDFFNRNHSLVPVGYCPEWWIQEVEKAVVSTGREWSAKSLSEISGVSELRCAAFISDFFLNHPTFTEALAISRSTSTPLHSKWTPYWSQIKLDELKEIYLSVKTTDGMLLVPSSPELQRIIGILGIPNKPNGEYLEFDKEWASALKSMLSIDASGHEEAISIIERMPSEMPLYEIVSVISGVQLRDKAGTFIGARMGRPEKAKMRKMTGSPHGLFPVGEEGGRMRSIQEALVQGKITADYPLMFCPVCKHNTIFARCDTCDAKTERKTVTVVRKTSEGEKNEERTYAKQEIQIRRIFEGARKKIRYNIYPDMIKGVRGTSNKSHIPEHIIKAMIRAKHDIAVNKDGTVRYDCSEVTLTHFRPIEIGVGVKRLKELGYTKDCKGDDLVSDQQVLELRPQDIVIPCCPVSPEEPSDAILLRVAAFVDELLEKLYGMEPFYKCKTRDDLVGQYVVGLAPHTSAGIVGRIIGFSSTQGFLAHPLYHAAMRRDCDGDESCFSLLMDVFLNFSAKFLPETRGSTMDAPLVLTYLLNPAEVDDMAFHVDTAWKYPLQMYEYAQEYKKPYDVKVPLLGDFLGTQAQFEGMGYTHDTSNINVGVLCSAYKTLPSMEEKLIGQMDIAVKLRACDASDVAKMVIEKHFLRDTKGNLRKFTQQEYRCVHCNEKYRRPPLQGKCFVCSGKVIFTISEGSVIKYLQLSIDLTNKYGITGYLKEDLEILQRKVDDLFGKDKEKQTGLADWA